MMLAVWLLHSALISALMCFLITKEKRNVTLIRLTGKTEIVKSQIQFYIKFHLFFPRISEYPNP